MLLDHDHEEGRCASTHLILKDISRERHTLPVHMRLDQRECAPNSIQRNVGQPEMRGHVDEVQAVGGQLAIPFDEEHVGTNLVEEGERGFGFGKVVAVESLWRY